MSLDGKIATASGESRWITGEAAREKVHVLRGRMDGIIAGIVTVLTDDPLLTARPPGQRTPARIILDSQLRLPPSSQLVQTARQVPVLVVHSPQAPETARRVLEEAGCECLPLQPSRGVPCILNLLDELGRRRFSNVLVEGGAAVLGSFLEAREIDEVWAFIAPKLLGGEKAPSPIAGYGAEKLAQALAVSDWQVEHFGADVLLRGWINRRGDARS
jgi:diaminohydroxyphosphoribosylaminopyrimidine deaminase/5-amino-6-(5-phosphoribosylamino)uracil reductase